MWVNHQTIFRAKARLSPQKTEIRDRTTSKFYWKRLCQQNLGHYREMAWMLFQKYKNWHLSNGHMSKNVVCFIRMLLPMFKRQNTFKAIVTFKNQDRSHTHIIVFIWFQYITVSLCLIHNNILNSNAKYFNIDKFHRILYF